MRWRGGVGGVALDGGVVAAFAEDEEDDEDDGEHEEDGDDDDDDDGPHGETGAVGVVNAASHGLGGSAKDGGVVLLDLRVAVLHRARVRRSRHV